MSVLSVSKSKVFKTLGLIAIFAAVVAIARLIFKGVNKAKEEVKNEYGNPENEASGV